MQGAVEGPVDEAVLERLVADAGAFLGQRYGKEGKDRLISRLGGYNAAAAHSPWVVLLDLDREPCAPSLVARLLPNPASKMALRVAVTEVESWIMADRVRFAAHFGLRVAQLPQDPDSLVDPKELIVSLARVSRKRAIRADMVPRSGSGRSIGPAYSSRLIEFVTDRARGWRPDEAAAASPSLQRCRTRLQELVHAVC